MCGCPQQSVLGIPALPCLLHFTFTTLKRALAVLAADTEGQHLLQSPATVTCFSHLLQSPATVTCYSHLLQSPATVTCYSHLIQLPATVTCYSYLLQSSDTVTCYSHLLQSPATVTCYSHLLQPHRMASEAKLLYSIRQSRAGELLRWIGDSFRTRKC